MVDRQIGRNIQEYELVLKKAKNDYNTKTNELKRLDEQIVEAITGNGAFTPQQLRRRMDSVQEEISSIRERIDDLQDRLEQTHELTEKISREYSNLKKRADVFQHAPLETQKLIAAEMIEYVKVSRDYEMEVKLSITFDQFMGGL